MSVSFIHGVHQDFLLLEMSAQSSSSYSFLPPYVATLVHPISATTHPLCSDCPVHPQRASMPALICLMRCANRCSLAKAAVANRPVAVAWFGRDLEVIFWDFSCWRK